MWLERACLWLWLGLIIVTQTAVTAVAEGVIEQKTSTTGPSSDDTLATRIEEKVLSRKRRYLTFPEGSSLQVGNNNYNEQKSSQSTIQSGGDLPCHSSSISTIQQLNFNFLPLP